MQTSIRPPRLFVLLLALVVCVLTLQVLLFSSNPIAGLLWPALVAAISLSAAFGSRRSASILQYLYFVMAALPLLFLLVGSSASALARMVFVSAFLIACGLYIARSRSLAEFYALHASHGKNAA